MLTAEEREAEELFREAMHRRVSAREARIRAAELERRNPIAGGYLRWLLCRFQGSLVSCAFEL